MKQKSTSEREQSSRAPIKLDDKLLVENEDVSAGFNILKPDSDQQVPKDIANKLNQLQMEVEDHEK